MVTKYLEQLTDLVQKATPAKSKGLKLECKHFSAERPFTRMEEFVYRQPLPDSQSNCRKSPETLC